MDASDVCPTEDAIQAFLDYLVDPMLPAKSSLGETPSQSLQKSVAKQVHAIVLLYNYYLRKRHPQLEVLGFEAFCKLAVILKPTLLAHMKFMQRSDDTELEDVEKQLSVTEKTIMEACDISRSLDASKDVPSIEGWPISKVAVLLIDSKKENCFLLFSSITQGVWSVIEKDLDISNMTSEGTIDPKQVNKKKRFFRKPSKDESSIDDSSVLQLAYLAAKEATGIDQTDLVVLESHIVYSLSKERTATRFYIMQCTQSVNEDVIQVPLKDAIDSLQGPLVRKSSGRWTVTPAVEYFHVLPYVGIVSTWLSSPDRTEKHCTPEIDKSQDRSHINDGLERGLSYKTDSAITKSLKQKENSGYPMIGLSGSLNGPQNLDVDESFSVPSQNGEKCKNLSNTVQVDSDLDKMTTYVETDLSGSPSDAKFKGEMVDLMKRPCITECRGKQIAAGNKICNNISLDQDRIGDHADAVVTYQSKCVELDKLQITIASKQSELSCTALRVLLRKRDQLSLQQRNIEDEIAQCDKKIQNILKGGEDDLALKLESILEGCNEVCLRRFTQERTYQHDEDQHSSQYFKRKRLSEAVLSMRNPCQELDSVCYENNWILPTYSVSTSDGGFKAGVTVNGMDFECSSGSDLCSNPREARESAAAHMLAKLQSIATSTL